MPVKFIDLFCGIGGFRFAIERICTGRNLSAKCVFSSDIDEACQKEYEANFSDLPAGDITKITADKIPDHDILLAGFPCQPFSIIGQQKGFEDTRGTLFFEIARILKEKKPQAFILENVKLLKGHDQGKTLDVILQTLISLGYSVDYKILNALDFGLPQKRERIWIVGFKEKKLMSWPTGKKAIKPLSEILEKNVPKNFYVSDRIRNKRWSVLQPSSEPTIWHENKAGHISAYPFSCALRAGASYNYLLVNGERRLTPREMLRLQGFPESFKIVCSDSQIRKQAGNSLPVDVAAAVLERVFETLNLGCQPAKYQYPHEGNRIQMRLLEKKGSYKHEKSKAENC